ncbi:MAG: hypothetical protein TREMPRED_002058 [Tremellales sp. Tagirdzhanova-0007]|nr:MAG: hypothetical protein TREMPRED_002058 [Tremellales sp. Tagirdzhanova-0007]
MFPVRPYMSPQLAHHFDHLTTTSPALLQGTLPQVEESHVIIHEYGPHDGPIGTSVIVLCDVNFPSTPPPSNEESSSPVESPKNSSANKALRVVFGQCPVQTAVHSFMEPARSGAGQLCRLTATVPNLSSTGGAAIGRAGQIPMYVQVLSETHAVIETIFVGEFIYTTTGSRGPPYSAFAQPTSIKRAGDSLESHRPSPNEYLHRRVLSNGPRVPSPDLNQFAQLSSTYQPSPQLGESSSSYPSPYLASSGTLPGAAEPAITHPSAQPNLMRSTQVLPSVPIPSPYIFTSGQKATLELTGDLMTMSKGWSQEEWFNRRRLVQFWRRQEGVNIYASFRPISQNDYPQSQSSIIVSCIFREDTNACYLTSVDTIYLLESLVGTRFTVEEKNRIRRNLEGFRPVTVSKNKPGNEDFFKLIMGFPSPKPRNIEKDVKVFPWEVMGAALKKIIAKYSASYTHATNVNMPPPQPALHPHPVAPLPMPLQPSSEGIYSNIGSSVSALTLQSHSSSDSSVYALSSSFTNNGPQTPHLPHSHSGSPNHFRTASTPPNEKGDAFVNLSPAQSPFGSTIGQGNSFWGSTIHPTLSIQTLAGSQFVFTG